MWYRGYRHKTCYFAFVSISFIVMGFIYINRLNIHGRTTQYTRDMAGGLGSSPGEMVPLDTQKNLWNATELDKIVDLVKHGKTSKYVKSCFMGKYCYNYILSPKEFCDSGSAPKLVVFAFSMEETRDRRDLIRQTWANKELFGPRTMKLVFLIGKPKKEVDLRESIEEEAAIYNDIVKYDFVEDVYNLTLKSLAGFEWVNRFCPQANFVMKIDDDMFMNTFAYTDHVNNLIAKNKTKNIIFCYVWRNGVVFRSGTHSLNKTVMPRDQWPPFCSGSAYMMSLDASAKLLTLALVDQRKDMLPLDDPYITGLLASYTNIHFEELNTAYLLFEDAQKTRKPDKMTDTDWKKFLTEKIFWHIHDTEFTGKDRKLSEHEKLWKEVLRFNNQVHYD